MLNHELKLNCENFPAWNSRNDEKGNKKAENSHASLGISGAPALLALCTALAASLKDTVGVKKVHRPSSSKVSYNFYTGRDEGGF